MAEFEEENMWGGYEHEYPESPGGGDHGDDEEMEDSSAVQQECIDAFSNTDFIMEPGVFSTLKRYFKSGGSPEVVVQLLSDNYMAIAQTANLIAEWLIQAGVDIKEVQELVERHLQDMILKYFDPKKADSIFTDEGELWLPVLEVALIAGCTSIFTSIITVVSNISIRFILFLISDAGHQGEITSVSTACHQIEVFSRVLRTSISSLLEGDEEGLEKNLPEFTKMVCHGEHTFLYSQLLMHILAAEQKGGANVKRIYQEVHKAALARGLDVTPITLSLSGASAYPRASQALASMLSRQALNPADITILYKMYNSNDAPPVEIIRSPQFIELFLDALYKPGAKINPEHRTKYVFLLAYASCVVETKKKGGRKAISKDELKATCNAIEKTHALCSENKGSSELVADVGTLFQCLKFPIAARGVLKWVEYVVAEPSYFKLNTDHTPLHLVLLDEISSNHLLLHTRILDLLINLFESTYEDLDVLVQLELRKTVLDRMVHLLSRGCVLQVVTYIKECVRKQETDISLIRHFVTEVLDMIAPPYTTEFVQLFMPLIENEDITGSLRSEDDNDPVSEFIGHCKGNDIVVT
ncbi:hypothetical protein CAPTEDRAFT_160748, partial [Capitella teleta]